MHNPFASVWAYTLVRWGIAGVFMVAGAVKLAAPTPFARTIADFGFVHPSTVMAVAIGLATLEILAGIALAFDVRGGLGTASALIALFTAVILYGLWLGLDVECGCFGPGDAVGGGTLHAALSRDIGVAAACAYLYGWRWMHRSRKTRKVSVDE